MHKQEIRRVFSKTSHQITDGCSVLGDYYISDELAYFATCLLSTPYVEHRRGSQYEHGDAIAHFLSIEDRFPRW